MNGTKCCFFRREIVITSILQFKTLKRYKSIWLFDSFVSVETEDRAWFKRDLASFLPPFLVNEPINLE